MPLAATGAAAEIVWRFGRVLAGFAALGLVALAGLAAGVVPAAAAPRAERPNIVLIVTDDQDVRSLRVMHGLERRLADRGTTFRNSFATFPLCCPSRATLLTGQYAHNHGVMGNRPPKGGVEAFRDTGTLPVALRRAGYRTGFVGKYLNGYDFTSVTTPEQAASIPPGWQDWYALLSFHFYNWELNENGRIVRYGKRAADYQTDVLADKASAFIRARANRAKPFFLNLSLFAPHGEHRGRLGKVPNPRPARRHRGAFAAEPLPLPPSFDEADVSDKPAFVRNRPRLDEEARLRLTQRHRDRLTSLLAVDDAVGRIVTTLRRTGELRDTVVIFTSDNGYLLGEHRLNTKTVLYEESARVPFVISGPGIARGKTRSQITANIDLAPTILDLAGADPLRPVDGRSVVRMTRKPSLGAGRSILLENASSTAVRTPEYLYAEHPGGETELYDLRADPFQLDSRHADPALAGVRAELAERLDELRDCAGAGCS